MTKRITQVFLVLMGLAFCKVGAEALLDPQAVLQQVGITLDSASALSSMRAVYGGMHFMFGCLCFWSAFRRPEPALLMVSLYTAGFVAGRLCSIFADGVPNAFVLTWFGTEVFSLVAALVLLKFQRQSAPQVGAAVLR